MACTWSCICARISIGMGAKLEMQISVCIISHQCAAAPGSPSAFCAAEATRAGCSSAGPAHGSKQAHSLQALAPSWVVTSRPPGDDHGSPPSAWDVRVAGTYPAAERREATSGLVHDARAEVLEARTFEARTSCTRVAPPPPPGAPEEA